MNHILEITKRALNLKRHLMIARQDVWKSVSHAHVKMHGVGAEGETEAPDMISTEEWEGVRGKGLEEGGWTHRRKG